MLNIYGLKNCDTCRKALKWLQQKNIDHQFHDLKTIDLTEKKVSMWLKQVPHETLINRRGTTWRGLPDRDKEALSPQTAGQLAVAHTSLLKRPIFELGKDVMVGFGPEQQDRLLSLSTK